MQIKVRICKVAYLLFKNKQARNNKPKQSFLLKQIEILRAQGILLQGKINGKKPKRWKVIQMSLLYPFVLRIW